MTNDDLVGTFATALEDRSHKSQKVGNCVKELCKWGKGLSSRHVMNPIQIVSRAAKCRKHYLQHRF